MRDFFREGRHTWDIHIEYHRCPGCGKIVESREGYERRLSEMQKDLECPHCEKQFTVSKELSKAFGPLFGKEK